MDISTVISNGNNRNHDSSLSPSATKSHDNITKRMKSVTATSTGNTGTY